MQTAVQCLELIGRHFLGDRRVSDPDGRMKRARVITQLRAHSGRGQPAGVGGVST